MKTKLLVLALMAAGSTAGATGLLDFANGNEDSYFPGCFQGAGSVPYDSDTMRKLMLEKLASGQNLDGSETARICHLSDIPFKNKFPGSPVNDFSGLIETDETPCVQVKDLTYQNPTSSIALISRSQAMEDINNFTMSNVIKGKVGAISFSNNTKFIKESISNRASLVFYYRYNVDYPLSVGYTANSNINNFLTKEALTWYNQSKMVFFRHCGNGFVSSLTGGVRFLAQIQIDLSSNTHRQEIENTLNVNYKSLVELENTIKNISKQSDNSFSIDISMSQFGGDPSKIGQAIGGQNFACSGTDISKCIGALDSATKYVQTIPEQIKGSDGKLKDEALFYYAPIAKKYSDAFKGFDNGGIKEDDSSYQARTEMERTYTDYLIKYYSMPNYNFLKQNEAFLDNKEHLYNRIVYLEGATMDCYAPATLNSCSTIWKKIQNDFVEQSKFKIDDAMLNFYRQSFSFQNYINLSQLFGNSNIAIFVPFDYRNNMYVNLNNFCGDNSISACLPSNNRITLIKSGNNLNIDGVSNRKTHERTTYNSTDQFKGTGYYDGRGSNWQETINVYYR